MIETRVQGTSMVPFLWDGQGVMLSAKEPAGGVRPGDVLAFRAKDGTFVIHRLIRTTRRGHFVTQGDHCIHPDKAWRREQLLGVLLAVRDERFCWQRPLRRVHGRAAMLLRLRWLPGRARIGLLRWLSNRAWTPLEGIPEEDEVNIVLPAVWAQESTCRWETQELGTELAVFDRKTGAVHMLNKQAALIWRKKLAGAGEEEIIESLVSEYPAVARGDIQRDVEATLKTIREAGLASD